MFSWVEQATYDSGYLSDLLLSLWNQNLIFLTKTGNQCPNIPKGYRGPSSWERPSRSRVCRSREQLSGHEHVPVLDFCSIAGTCASGSGFNCSLGSTGRQNRQRGLSWALSPQNLGQYCFLKSPFVRKKLLHWEVRFIYGIDNVPHIKKLSFVPIVGEMYCFCGCQLKHVVGGFTFSINLDKSLNFVRNLKVAILEHPSFSVNNGKLTKVLSQIIILMVFDARAICSGVICFKSVLFLCEILLTAT